MVDQPQAIKTGSELAKFRGRLGLSQAAMAEAVGLTLRPYQDIEAGKTPVKLTLSLAAEMISMRAAIGHGDALLAFPTVRKEAKMLAELVARPKVRAYRYRVWDITTGEWATSSRLATAEKIQTIGGKAIPNSGEDIDPNLLTDGWTEKGFVGV